MPYVPIGQDQLAIPNPDPARAYRWIASDIQRLTQHLRSYGKIPGYSIVNHPDGPTQTQDIAEQLGLPKEMVNVAMNRIMWGDLVLADIPIEEMNRRTLEKLCSGKERVSNARERAESLADELPGIRVRKESPEELVAEAEFHRTGGKPQVSIPEMPSKKKK